MSEKREHTLEALRMALLRVERGRTHTIDPSRKLSIAAVAEEAGVSPATIHNRHPEIADQIRRLLDKEVRKQRDVKHQSLQAEKAKNQALRQALLEREQEIAKLASITAALEAENAQLRAIVEAKNVAVLPRK